MSKLFIGTSGYNYRHWKEVFYPKEIPQKKWMEYYSSLFNTVEINATFYGNFKKEVFEDWRGKTPSDFYFAIKGPRYITHVKRLKDVSESVEMFFNNASGLGNKLSVVLWQFPKNFKNNEDNFERLKEFLEVLPDERHAFEFRDGSWFSKDVFSLLSCLNCQIVVNSSGVFPEGSDVSSNFHYIRFHGPSSLYSSNYSYEQLWQWSVKIKKILKSSDVYCYFNNDANAYAIDNAKELKKLVLGSK